MSKDTNDNYAQLFAAIYGLAVKEDYREVCRSAIEKLISSGADKYKVREYIKIHSNVIKDKVCKNVYRESQDYGDGTKTKRMRSNNIKNLVEQITAGYGKSKGEI